MPNDPRWRKDGLWCDNCDGFHGWHQLAWEVDEERGMWAWSCPWCKTVLRVDPYNPPADLPEKVAPSLQITA